MAERPTIRPARESELNAVHDLADLAFHRGSTPLARERRLAATGEVDTVVADDDGTIVGTAAAFPWPMVVPGGGEVPCAAVTGVTVRPTHRRRGVLRALMTQLTERARERGEPVAALWASEGTIYGRFGFGPATWARDEHVRVIPEPVLRDPAPEPLGVRLLDAAQALPVLPAIHARARGRRPGIMGRTERWWADRVLADEPEDRGGASPLRVAVAAGDEGYALWRVREGHETHPVAAFTTVEVQELVAATPEAERALFTFVARIDLADELVLRQRPVDDPLALAPVDARAVRPLEQHEGLWLRILDLPAAVAARAWAAPVDVVVDVEHPEDEVVAGRWALRAGPDGGAAERTERPADLRLHARDLGSVYLGGVALATLRDAGVVAEETPGACAALDAALRVERAPWTLGTF
jgi:predicted acetyltransferase